MHDITQSKTMLERALANMPDDNALSNVRSMLRRSLVELNTYSEKRQRRDNTKKTIAEEWKKKMEDAHLYRVPLEDAKVQLSMIEKMIADEQDNLQHIEKMKSQQKAEVLRD